MIASLRSPRVPLTVLLSVTVAKPKSKTPLPATPCKKCHDTDITAEADDQKKHLSLSLDKSALELQQNNTVIMQQTSCF